VPPPYKYISIARGEPCSLARRLDFGGEKVGLDTISISEELQLSSYPALQFGLGRLASRPRGVLLCCEVFCPRVFVFCPRFVVSLPPSPARFPCGLTPSAGALILPYNTLQTSVLLPGSSLNRPLAVRLCVWSRPLLLNSRSGLDFFQPTVIRSLIDYELETSHPMGTPRPF